MSVESENVNSISSSQIVKKSGVKEVQEILDLIAGYRYLAAFEKYTTLREKLSQEGDHDESMTKDWHDETEQAIKENIVEIEKMLERAEEVQTTLEYEDNPDQWIYGTQMFGIKTYYQIDKSDNSIIIKLEGVMEDLPLFEQCAVIYEIDLFKEWIPFCRESELVDKVGKAELVPYLLFGVPPISRDFGLIAYGADCLFEHGKLLILGKSIEQHDPKPIPFRETGWFHDRMYVKQFKSLTDVISPTSAKTQIIAHIDPNAPLPQSFLNLIIKNIAGVLLYCFQKQVLKVIKDPNCQHAKRVRSNGDFYLEWLLPKLRSYCDFKGWIQPNINCLGEIGIFNTDQEKAEETIKQPI